MRLLIELLLRNDSGDSSKYAVVEAELKCVIDFSTMEQLYNLYS